MAYIVSLPKHHDIRGGLTVVDNILPYEIKRVYFIYDVPKQAVRGGHRHKKTIQGLICIKGSCKIHCNDGEKKTTFNLRDTNQCLVLEPQDYHTMSDFSSDAILLVLSSEHYDRTDYIDEDYK